MSAVVETGEATFVDGGGATVADEGEATVDATGTVVSVPLGVEVHAASRAPGPTSDFVLGESSSRLLSS